MEGKAPLPEVLQTVLAIIGIAALGAIFGEATTAALRGLQVLLGTWTVGWVGVVGATVGGRANGVLAAWIAAPFSDRKPEMRLDRAKIARSRAPDREIQPAR